MYEDHVLEHFGDPYHKGPMPAGPLSVLCGRSVSSVCGDEVAIQACTHDGVIDDIWWQGEGCCFSQAAASMLVEYAHERTIVEMKEFTENEMLSLFQAECPKIRRGCVLVAWNALKEMLQELMEKT